MDLTLYFKDTDELTAFCMLPDTTAQDAALAERIAELSRDGVHIEGMQCNVKHRQQ